MYKILVQIDDSQMLFDLGPSPLVIGRGKASDVRIIQEGVSRRHAQISIEGDSVYIEDLGSANGIFINDKKIQREKLTTFFPAKLTPHVTVSLEAKSNIEITQVPITIKRPVRSARPSPNSQEKKSSKSANNKALTILICASIAAASFYIAKEIMDEKSPKESAPVVSGKVFKKTVVPSQKLCSNAKLSSLCQAFSVNTAKGYGFYMEKGKVQGAVEFKELSKSMPKGLRSKEDYQKLIASKLNGGALNDLDALGAKVLAIDFIQRSEKHEARYTRCMIDLVSFFKASRKNEMIVYDTASRKTLQDLIVVIDI